MFHIIQFYEVAWESTAVISAERTFYINRNRINKYYTQYTFQLFNGNQIFELILKKVRVGGHDK